MLSVIALVGELTERKQRWKEITSYSNKFLRSEEKNKIKSVDIWATAQHEDEKVPYHAKFTSPMFSDHNMRLSIRPLLLLCSKSVLKHAFLEIVPL